MKRIKTIPICFLGSLLLNFSTVSLSQAQDFYFGEQKSFFFGVGAFLPNILGTAGSPSGSTGLLGSKFGELSIAYRMRLNESLTLIPTVGFTLVGSGNIDGSSTNRYISLVVPVSFPLFGSLEFRSGVGLMLYQISGSGGSTTLSNGTGTLEFTLPGQSRTSTFLILDVGVGFPLFGDFRFDINTYVTGFLTTRRGFSLVTRLGWGIF